MTSIFALPAETLLAFAVFALVASITPGPNNAMLMASGANFGFRRTLPHMAGVVLGFSVMVVAVGLGLGGLFTAYPAAQDILWFVGTAYLLWLAWKVATSSSIGSAGARRPLRFIEAVAFQWVNPKAWSGALGAIAAYAPKDNYLAGLAMITGIFVAVNIPVVMIWTGGGMAVRRLLTRPGALATFNVVMGLALVLSLIPSAIERLVPPIRLF